MNHLSDEKSPYLLQHADNPVDWHPWGEAAFARARAEQKPIFLSIGYSTCHWCHVMAHESFENPAVAGLLNGHFIPIKVDREERPDVDRVYMSYVQALTGHGGWPLSAWLTPELKPFYGGTYYPPEDRQGRPGFPTILNAIARGWRDERDKLVAEAENVLASLRNQSRADGQLLSDVAERANVSSEEMARLLESASDAFEAGFDHLRDSFDAERGGFGGAPKFPRAGNLAFLFRCAAMQGVATDFGREALDMAARTLQQMARGGIHDHVGGGFHRYAVDENWFVPHFEKMLYSQAQIALNALEAWQGTGDERHAWLARDIFSYVLRDLTSPEGGFYSAEDADSAVSGPENSGTGFQPVSSKTHGLQAHATISEGAFYIWPQSEIESLLGPDAALFCSHYDVRPDGNVPADRDPFGEFTGRNILAQSRSLVETARELGLDSQEASDRLTSSLERLRAARGRRPRPHLDDKILTAWNGLMISALARASLVPAESLADERKNYLAAAIGAAEFVRRELYDAARDVLFRSWREDSSPIARRLAERETMPRHEGFAEDYAFLIQGLLDLYEATFDLRWLQWAEKLQAKMDELFWDEAQGGYFNSAAGASDIIIRLKEDYDGAEPAPSSVAVMNLLRLDAIFPRVGLDRRVQPSAIDDPKASGIGAQPGRGERPGAATRPYLHRERALRALTAFQPRWTAVPQALPQMLCALELALGIPRHVVLVGDSRSPEFQVLAMELHARLGPRRSIVALDGGPAQAWLADRAPWLAAMQMLDGKPTAYLCEEYACQAPVNTPEELRRLLR